MNSKQVNEDKNLGDAVVETKTETPLDAFRRSAGFQIMFVLHSGLQVGRAIDHLCASAAKYGAAMREWQPIETAPRDGRTLLLGYFNSLNKWRTLRGQWFSDEAIGEWENGEDFEAGWYETSVEVDDVPNAWTTNPTHWMPLPDPPCLSINNETQPGQAS